MRPPVAWAAVLAFCTAASASPAHGDTAAVRSRHAAMAARELPSTQNTTLQKRAEDARATFYAVGLGACGKHNVPTDFIVALNSAQFGGGYPAPHCFASITISHNGKTAGATIMDECPGCPYRGLDMSAGLFEHFEPLSAGVFYMDWWFNDGSHDAGPPESSDPPPKPTTTKPAYTPPPEPKSTTHKTTSTTHRHTSTSESTTSTSKTSTRKSYTQTSESTTTTDSTTASTTTTSAAPTSTDIGVAGNLASLMQVIVNLNGLAVAAAGVVAE